MFRSTKFILAVLCVVLSACSQTGNTRVSVDYYPVSGSTSVQLDHQIRKNGPRGENNAHALAVARIKFKPIYRVRRNRLGCRVAYARVKIDARVTLPRWAQRHAANGELGKAWDNLERYAKQHETVHVVIASAYASRMEKGLLSIPPQASCRTTKHVADKFVQKLLKDHDRSQRRFDSDEKERISRLVKK